MNLLHLKYAIEVEKTLSINKAAENLFMGQPNLSRAIKELEESLGIIIFNRTSKGITPTLQGQEFLQYAKRILAQIDEVESMYKNESIKMQSFSVSVPRSSYISCAFTEFAKNIDVNRRAEIFYKETNAMRAINNILNADYKLGIVRYQNQFEQYFNNNLVEKGLEYEVLNEFSYELVMSKHNSLSKKEKINFKDLKDYIEIAHGDPFVPSLPFVDAKKAELSEFVDKRIFVFERSSQMDLLSNVHNSFMWVSPIPQRILKMYNLVKCDCEGNNKVYRDVLIYRKGYKFSELDNKFLNEVRKMKDGKLYE